ncbi:transcriptional coactivator p15/PC4 family protein [Paraburkholderia sp.]|uniref:transcriptional coactivator p15/PC4 family protein n=1 Tax=Paraburkholderia sp. TaxID=1926495 RepID=UPI003C7AF2D1
MQSKKMASPHGNANTGDDVRDFGTTILEVQKNSRERVRISVDRFKGLDYVVARVWYVDASGEFRPSRQGITLKPSLVPQLIQGLELAARAADPKGAN